jgi:hypothetical protein
MKIKLLPTWCIALFLAMVLLAFPMLTHAQSGNAVTAADQDSDGTNVTVAGVTAAAPGWMVIHIDNNGSPGPVLGQTAVAAGDNSDVVVAIDPPLEADTTLWAMLHVDEGVIGTYEFPGADVPVKDGDMVVMTPFTAKVAAMGTDTTTTEATTDTTTKTEETAEGAAPEVLPVTGTDISGIAQALPAIVATLSALAGSIWISRRRRS